MGGTCYGVRATLLVGLVTDEKALYTESTWGQAVGAGVRVGYPVARSGRPKKRPMLRIIGLRMFARAVCPPYVRSWFWLGTSKAQTHLMRHSNHL